MKTIAKKIINDNPLASTVYLVLMLAAAAGVTYAQAEPVIKEQIFMGR